MKINHYIYILTALLLASCADDQEQWSMSPTQQALIGQGVNFSMSYAEPFATRVTYRHDGSFNEKDEMTIYRQYSNDGGNTFDPATEAYRVYSLESKRATGTDIVLETDWKPIEGRYGKNPDTDDYPVGKRGLFRQEESDSLTWDNGQTVRFRAWSRSNMSNAIERSKNKDYYYPDYCVADWATVSGPTLSVPMTLKHQACRIGFTQKPGNELYQAEICTDWRDYCWPDNSTDNTNDEAATEHGKTEAQARAEAESVLAVYNQMCMPSGVDVSTSVMTAMTKEMYEGPTDFSDLSTASEGIVKINENTPGEIREYVQRPLFTSNIDGRMYMVTIPYDMSSSNTSGETLKLPACTRFKIWLYDVNNGDKANTPDKEANYHIFTLGDAKDNKGAKLFENGLELVPGRSYVFSVGYHYDHFDVTPVDDFSWHEEDPEDGNSTNAAQEYTPNETPYKWWQDAIKVAIPQNITQSYNPHFHITTEAEFLEFINLVNGTAATKTSGLTQVPRPEKTYDRSNPVLDSDYRWYKSTDIDAKGNVIAGRDSVTHAEAIEEGYIFYRHYYPADADQAAYSREDYLRGPYSFYDENLNRHFTVHLDADLDFYDKQLTTIGIFPSGSDTNDKGKPFRGVFDGYDETNNTIHKIKNINMDGGYMFSYCKEAAIKNLYIETTHNFMLVNQAVAPTSTGYGAYIVGISIKAPSSGNPIARTLTGSSYVVGCIYQGRAGGAMVGTADNLNMYANMMAASGLTSGTGALLGAYATGSAAFFAPQAGQTLSWGHFHANYYDVTLSPGTHAVGAIIDAYRPQEYIRGRESWILKAKNDNLLSDEVPFETLTSQQMKDGYYGLAPWKAMNYALYAYNLVGAQVSEAHNCKSHYVNSGIGYAHVYPHLEYGEPNSNFDQTGCKGKYEKLDLLEQNN